MAHSKKKLPKPAKPTASRQPSSLDASRCATIFGGGIAGLTVAHELIERGYRVQVWEPASDARHPQRGCDVGGMARSQWGAVPWSETETLPTSQPRQKRDEDYFGERQTHPIADLPQVFYCHYKSPKQFTKWLGFRRNDYATGKMGPVVDELVDDLETNQAIEFIYCEIQRRNYEAEALNDQLRNELVNQFKVLFGRGRRLHLVDDGGAPNYNWQRRLKVTIPNNRELKVVVVVLDGFPTGVPDEFNLRISFRVRERWLPGEHGFRFFPAFYYHVFDTMKRTPILQPVPKSTVAQAQERSVTVNPGVEKYLASGSTVFDNLRSTSKVGLGLRANGRPTLLSRSKPTSLEEIRQLLRVLLGAKRPTPPSRDPGEGGFACTARDIARMQVMLLKYLTSCPERRHEYEQMTWMDFLGGTEVYSQAFVDMTNGWPEALVAMDAKTIDARTQGSVFVQLLLEDAEGPGYRDGTLAGPTTEVWFKYWKSYLEAQGVEFIQGKLTGFRPVPNPDRARENIVWPTVECYEPRYPLNNDPEKTPLLMPGYFVLALDAPNGKEVAGKYLEARFPDGTPDDWKTSDLYMLAKLDLGTAKADGVVVDNPKVVENGQLRHMVGIQYFFDQDPVWFDGHIYFPYSDWGISGITQTHFWQDRADWEHGYRGVLSIVFQLTKSGKDLGVWKKTPVEIATAIWEQIAIELPDIPAPTYFHLDENFEFRNGQPGYVNKSPYLINRPGDWEKRPGRLPPLEAGTSATSGYEVRDGIVLAGTYMKTYTRITTMEAANESGRHAVNGILKNEQTAHFTGVGVQVANNSLCTIWPIEEREVTDFRFLKEIDAELYARGLDHFVDILELADLAGTALSGKARDPFDASGALRTVSEMLERFSGTLRDAATTRGDRP